MSEKSAIEWTDSTWNPVLGCDKVSQGCRGCYAIPQSWMKQSNPSEKVRAAYEGLVEKVGPHAYNWTGRVNLLHDRLTLPLTWKQPRRIFVTSLSDLFHKDVPDEFIYNVFTIMGAASWHTFQILTKRPERMASWVTGFYKENPQMSVLPNVWLGTSTEDQKAADDRMPWLLQTPAAVRFLSCEPLLGPIDFWPMLAHLKCSHGNLAEEPDTRIDGCGCFPDRSFIDWVIGGGESGPNFRPLNLDWARSLRDQCVAAGVAFNFKQVGGRTPKAGGRELDGRTWDEFPTPAPVVEATAP